MEETEIKRLRSEVRLLKEQNATLVQEKEALQKRYESDIRKWKEFKEWVLLGKGGPDKASARPKKRPRLSLQDAIAVRVEEASESNIDTLVSEVTTSKSRSCPTTPTKNKGNSQVPEKENEVRQPESSRAKEKSREETTEVSFNSRYRLNPAMNDGRDHQFDEVVRRKEDRQKLDGEACECCRDYYEVIGPLPVRPQPPLWKSPPSTPVKKKRACLHGSPRHNRASSSSKAVSDHMNKISRHRRRWEAPSTPPDYWKIGFPDTQETADINRRAREIHERKMARAEAETRSGSGRYQRR